jgi:hypothetical protein
MDAAWQTFSDELARWRDAGRVVDFWWRDDDAAAPSGPFMRLLQLAQQGRIPLGLAVIPERAEPALFEHLNDGTAVLQHGVDHRDRSAAHDKASEFPATESQDSALSRIAAGYARLRSLAGSRMLPVLVPPWNRFSPTLIECLPALGFRGYSTFEARTSAQPAPGLRQANAHVDIIAWRLGRVFVGDDRALALAAEHLARRRSGEADAAEPTGWLTHHLRHDEAMWGFLARLFEFTRARTEVRWLTPAEVFALEQAG